MQRQVITALGLGAVLALVQPASAQPRTLRWRALEVTAHLDADGRLHVRERQAIVFNGDWNGAERWFRLGHGHRLELRSLRRVDGDAVRELTPGDPPKVDQYAWAEPDLLRWRSRAPGDPPFRQTEIVYVLEYTLSDILLYRDGLLSRDGLYVLDHDFAFAGRPVPIDRFTLELSLDPAWRSLRPLGGRIERGALPAGARHPVQLALHREATTSPAAVDHGSPGLRLALLLLLLGSGAAWLARFWRDERRAGRLEPLPSPDHIDGGWLEQHLLPLPAEVAGAIWDRSVGPPEVAALLARLEAEGRIETWGDSGTGHLRLRVGRESLVAQDRALIDALLVGRGDETDTHKVRRHYRATGFDPAEVIRVPLEAQVRRVLGPERGRGRPWIGVVGLLVVGVAGLAAGLIREGDGPILPAAAGAQVALLVMGLVLGRRWRSRLDGTGTGTALTAIVVTAVGVAAALFARDPRVSLVGLVGVAAVAVAVVHAVLGYARSRDTPPALQVRKRLTAARRFLARRLRDRSGTIPDGWFPYLLALGLGDDANRWASARSTGGDGSAAERLGSAGAPGSADGPSFTGGGGRFGGAGATGSWAAAAQAFSASVPTPSSEGGSSGSSGSSSGSSSSSSGGGGGGGW